MGLQRQSTPFRGVLRKGWKKMATQAATQATTHAATQAATAARRFDLLRLPTIRTAAI